MAKDNEDLIALYGYSAQYARVPQGLCRYLRQLGATPTDVLVVIELLTYRWTPSSEVRPNQKTLLELTGLDRRQLQRSLRHLEELGLVAVTPGAGQRASRYDFAPMVERITALRSGQSQEPTSTDVPPVRSVEPAAAVEEPAPMPDLEAEIAALEAEAEAKAKVPEEEDNPFAAFAAPAPTQAWISDRAVQSPLLSPEQLAKLEPRQIDAWYAALEDKAYAGRTFQDDELDKYLRGLPDPRYQDAGVRRRAIPALVSVLQRMQKCSWREDRIRALRYAAEDGNVFDRAWPALGFKGAA